MLRVGEEVSATELVVGVDRQQTDVLFPDVITLYDYLSLGSLPYEKCTVICLCSADCSVGRALDSHTRGQGFIPGCGSWRRGLEQATHVQLLRSTQSMHCE